MLEVRNVGALILRASPSAQGHTSYLEYEACSGEMEPLCSYFCYTSLTRKMSRTVHWRPRGFTFFLIHIGFEFCFILEFTDIPKNWILHFIKSMPTTARNPSTVQSLGFNVQIAFWNWMATSSSEVSWKMKKLYAHTQNKLSGSLGMWLKQRKSLRAQFLQISGQRCLSIR